MQHRQVLCRQIYANRTLNVHTSHCQNLERPETASTCQLKICSEWQIRSEWTAVSGSVTSCRRWEPFLHSSFSNASISVCFKLPASTLWLWIMCRVSVVLSSMWPWPEDTRGALRQQPGRLCSRRRVQHEPAARRRGELWHGGLCQELVLHRLGQHSGSQRHSHVYSFINAEAPKS